VNRKEELNEELQQVGAYGTFHKTNQTNVPLMQTDEEEKKTVEASQDRAQ
jgi:hypothetical protein